MAFFEWDNSLDVGVEAMNEQHKTLISLMETLHEKNVAGAPKAELLTAVNTLIDYVIKHFEDEEAFMASIGFPGLETHKKLHENLLKELKQFSGDFERSVNKKIKDELTTFLKFWLATHIRGIDTRYGVHAQGIS